LTERHYKNISVKTELAETIEKFVRENPNYGYRSIAQFMEDAARKRLEELRALGVPPRFGSFNKGPDGVRITDNRLGKIADIYFKPKGVWCDLDKARTCEHIEYALTLPDVQEFIRRRRKEGWKLPDV